MKNSILTRYDVETDKTDVIEFEMADSDLGSIDYPPFIPNLEDLTETAFETEAETKQSLQKMGLLNEQGTFDEDAYSKLPSVDDNELITGSDLLQGIPDNREQIDKTKFPYSCLVRLAFYVPGLGPARGSGVIIGRYTVLTCAHVLCAFGTNTWYSDMVVIGSFMNNSSSYQAKAKSLVTTTSYYNGLDKYNDWGFITTGTTIGAISGHLGLFYPAPDFAGKQIMATGYPKTVRNSYTTDLFGAKGIIGNKYSQSDLALRFNAFVSGGQSGGSLQYTHNGYDNAYTLGIIIHEIREADNPDSIVGGGARMLHSPLVLEYIKWMEQHDKPNSARRGGDE